MKQLFTSLLTGLLFCVISIPSSFANSEEEANDNNEANIFELWDILSLNHYISKDAYSRAFEKINGQAPTSTSKLIAIIDFSKPSSKERMVLIDLEKQQLIYHNLVSHGKGSGDLEAIKFSNIPNSHQSSLGLYRVGEHYIGKHGPSRRLDGLERKINDKARERAIVIHAADYASPSFVEQHGRLGRSFGCPAVPQEGYQEFIKSLEEGSLLFIYHPSYGKK
ncbi:murein L,D-transpeptidase catalytic domain family protein [Persicobacter diffluens]|uniref:Murein L,D-transpeptidase catalytic domain family protein n=1 Tax=Persicobacter diffluens TaxID=981 RepID=A0AAN4W2Q8_9BACT|nr:hypothetical protein PEDI_37340 [Persicobacter diffluens]